MSRHANTTHGGSRSQEYLHWKAMRYRCSKPTDKSYPRYGGRGITVCEKWENNFAAFFADMGPKPSPEHTLDRYPNRHGNYEPGNVRWATRSEQELNKDPFRRGRKPSITKGGSPQ